MAKVKYIDRKATLDDGLVNPEEDKKDSNDGWMIYDATRPLEGDCYIKLLTFDDPEGKETFWHSSAHVLGETLENEFGVHLCHGPPTDQGFFYDSYTGKDVSNIIANRFCGRFFLISNTKQLKMLPKRSYPINKIS